MPLSISPIPHPPPLLYPSHNPKDTTQGKKPRKKLSSASPVPKNTTHWILISIHMQRRKPHPPRGCPRTSDSENGLPWAQPCFLFLGRPWSVLGRGSVVGRSVMVGQSVTVHMVGVSVVRCQFLTVLEIGLVSLCTQ